MTTYPLTLPDGFEVEEASFSLTTAASANASPFTFAEQTYLHPGARWHGEVSLIPMKADSSAEIKAFLTKLKGRYGTFLYSDPYYYVSGPLGAADGSPQVDGAAQTGNELMIKSGPAGRTKWLMPSDFIQIGTGTSARLHMVTDQVDVAPDGTATIPIEPDLKSSPSDSAAVIVNDARGVFALAENSVEWQYSEGVLHRVSFAFSERINV